jgi:HPt (histidine-containing phosphotransfer) domain-containing protein
MTAALEGAPAQRAAALAAALEEMRAALAGLRGTALTAEGAVQAAAAARALDRIAGLTGGARAEAAADPCAFDPEAFDPAPLGRLCALIGPEESADLRHRLTADLVTLRCGIAAAFGPPPDHDALRRHAHGLVSVAGTCGATGLHRAAMMLQAALAEGVAPPPGLQALIDAGFEPLFARIGPGAAPLGA